MNTLVTICQTIGSRIPIWTQGPGSNVSIKENSILWIKASGVRLDAVTIDNGIAQFNYLNFLTEFNKKEISDSDAELVYSNLLQTYSKVGRPSMETGFHAALPKKYVFHFHSLPALLMAHQFNNKTFLPPENAVVLPAIQPGLVLSKKIAELKSYSIFILENHGVILQSDSPDILNEWEEFEIRFCEKFKFSFTLSQSKIKTPLKLYFPDSAVFYDRLKKVSISSDPFSIDKDAAELWWATRLLYQCCPELNELPSSISTVVGSLPTELFRKGISA